MKIERNKLFLAALVADRINEHNYIGLNTIQQDGRIMNYVLMEKVLSGDIIPADEDIHNLQEFEESLNSWIIHSALSGEVTDFEKSIANLLSEDTIEFSKLKIIASLPNSVRRRQRDVQTNRMISDAKDEYIDSVGSSVTFTADIVKCFYSQQWSKYYVTVLTDTNHLAMFGSKVAYPPFDKNYRFAGKVSAHAIMSPSGKYQTRLTHVRRIA